MKHKYLFISLNLFLFLTVFSLAAAELPQKFYEKVRQLGIKSSSYVLFVSSAEQELHLFHDDMWQKKYMISTALNGMGSDEGSQKTPKGLHRIAYKIGNEAPLFTIFDARLNTGRIWQDDLGIEGDKVLTRILWLEGLERGVNSGRNSEGKNVDSFKRLIYIHGTNEEDKIGEPASHGCIRMYNSDVVELFQEIPKASLVWLE